MITTILAISLGASLGFLYWKFIGCAGGSCAITSNKFGSMAMGALLGLMLAGNLSHAQTASKMKNVDNASFKEAMKLKEVVIIDMRTSGEVRAGIIPGAINIDVYDPQFKEKLKKLDKSKKYLIYCRSGARSSSGGNQMIQLGFTDVVNLKRGIMGWDGPVTK